MILWELAVTILMFLGILYDREKIHSTWMKCYNPAFKTTSQGMAPRGKQTDQIDRMHYTKYDPGVEDTYLVMTGSVCAHQAAKAIITH